MLLAKKEIREVVFQMHPNRAPGADGFNGAFYRATWDIISSDLLEAINNFLRSGCLLTQVNHTIIYLIPKTLVPKSNDNF